ncbi:hypothetical protein [Paenibacillus sp. NPDC093718]|uniref:hypothetical protein n=1 Tax=Paenibacillus sp. NPDC093718 TaxID=3390601 RepID=UPI003D027EE4
MDYLALIMQIALGLILLLSAILKLLALGSLLDIMRLTKVNPYEGMDTRLARSLRVDLNCLEDSGNDRRAAVREAEILILDEPTSALDP